MVLAAERDRGLRRFSIHPTARNAERAVGPVVIALAGSVHLDARSIHGGFGRRSAVFHRALREAAALIHRPGVLARFAPHEFAGSGVELAKAISISAPPRAPQHEIGRAHV